MARDRKGTPVDVVVRLLVLKHMRNWSTRCSSARSDRTWCTGSSPASALQRCPTPRRWAVGLALGPAIIEQIHQRLVAIAQEQKIISGRKMRVDTTVVETDIHYADTSSR